MEAQVEEVVCCNSLNDVNTWYIFRPNGVEVKIVFIKSQFKPDKKLIHLEIEYLNNNLI